MSRTPTRRTWRLTTLDGTLVFDASHGTFPVRAMDPPVARVVATLPDEVEVECEGEYEGGRNIDFLVATKLLRIVTPLAPIAGEQDADIALGGDIARARAAERLGTGNIAGAASDLAIALRHGAAAADEVYAVLPAAEQAALVDALATWATQRGPDWRFLRWLPLEQWTDAHLTGAVKAALAQGGKFGERTGEELIAELDRRGRDTTKSTKALEKLRRARATEGGTAFWIATPLMQPRVVGATRDRVYVHGKLEVGPSPSVKPGAKRELMSRVVPVVIAYDTEGIERERHVGVIADCVIAGVAVMQNRRSWSRWLPHVRRLDGTLVFDARGIWSYDHELAHVRNHEDRDEVVELTTGKRVALLPPGYATTVWWDAEHIHVDGPEPCMLSRATGARVAGDPKPPPARTRTAGDGHTWTVHHTDASRIHGWDMDADIKRIDLGPIDGDIVTIELADMLCEDLVPPWLVLRRHEDPFLLVALAELVTCERLRVGGTLIAKQV